MDFWTDVLLTLVILRQSIAYVLLRKVSQARDISRSWGIAYSESPVLGEPEERGAAVARVHHGAGDGLGQVGKEGWRAAGVLPGVER